MAEKMQVGLATGAAVISGLVAAIFPLPLGLEGYFQFGLAPLGGFAGVFWQNKISETILKPPVFSGLVRVLGLLVIAIVCGFVYLIMHYRVIDPTTPFYMPIIVEGLLFAAFFVFFAGFGRGAGLALKGESVVGSATKSGTDDPDKPEP